MMDTEIPIGYGIINNEGMNDQMEGNVNKKSKSTKGNEDDLLKEIEVIEKTTYCWCLKIKKKRFERVSNESVNGYSDNNHSINNNLKEKLLQN